MTIVRMMMNNLILHFEITPGGRIKFHHKIGDTRLRFYKGKARKVSTIRKVGECFLAIAKKAEQLNKYK